MRKLFLICLLTASPVFAESEMSIEDAIGIGLEYNFDIRMARIDVQITENNQALGKAGFLPKINLNGSAGTTKSNVDSTSDTNSGDSVTNNWSTELALNWTLFDGFQMYAENKKYKALASLGQNTARSQIEATVVNISREFFNLVHHEQLLSAIENSVDISETRLKKEEIRRELGAASSTDYLNAVVAFNTDKALFIEQELNVKITQENLNSLLGFEPGTRLNVSKTITIPRLTSNLEEITLAAVDKNSTLKIARQDLTIAQHNVDIQKAAFLPEISFNSAVRYNDLNISPTLEGLDDIHTESFDLSAGLNISMNLFNGGRDSTSLKNAILESRNRMLAYENTTHQVISQVHQTHATYLQRLELTRLEEQNVAAAEQNLQLQQDRYKIGATSSIEFRDAQVSLLRAQSTLIKARYQARISRLELQQLTGNLDLN